MTWKSSPDFESVEWISPSGTQSYGPQARFAGAWWSVGVFGTLAVSHDDDAQSGDAVTTPGFGSYNGLHVLEVPTMEIAGRLKSTGGRFKTPAQVPI